MNPAALRLLRQSQFIALALFAFWSNTSIAISQIFFGISLTCFLILVVAEHHQPFVKPLRPMYIAIGLFVLWIFFTAALGATPLRSMWIAKEEWLFLIIPAGIYAFRDSWKADTLVLALAAGLTLVSIYGVIQHFTGIYWLKDHFLHRVDHEEVRLAGFFSHPLTYGNYTATASLFMVGFVLTSFRRLQGWRRWLVVSAAVMGPVATAMSNSRGPALALIVGLFIVGLLWRKVHYVLVALVLVVGISMITSEGLIMRIERKFKVDTQLRYEGGRLFIWYNSLKVIRDHPVFGAGQGNFYYEYIKHLRPDAPEYRKMAHAHDDMLNIAGISGIPGLILFMVMWVMVVRLLWKGYRSGWFPDQRRSLALAGFLASITFFVSSLTEATFADEEVRQLLMFCWAAGLAGWYKDESRSENRPVEQTS
jgi:O-antigen ligase